MMKGVTKGGRGRKRRKKDMDGPAEEDERERGRREIEKKETLQWRAEYVNVRGTESKLL